MNNIHKPAHLAILFLFPFLVGTASDKSGTIGAMLGFFSALVTILPLTLAACLIALVMRFRSKLLTWIGLPLTVLFIAPSSCSNLLLFASPGQPPLNPPRGLQQKQIGQPLRGHNGAISEVAFSPDGKLVAAGGEDKTVILWDVDTHEPSGQPLTGFKDRVTSVAFSPDGKSIASASMDNSIILWDVKTRQAIGQPLTTSVDAPQSIVFSPDGKMLASGGFGRISVWDVNTQRLLWDAGTFGFVYSVAFSPDGNMLASGSMDDSITFWDVNTHQPIGEPLRRQSGWVYSVAFSPDGNILASGSMDGSVIFWDVNTHQPIGQPLKDHKGISGQAIVSSVAFSPDGKTLASGSYDQSIILSDVTTHESITQLWGHTHYVASVAFSPDGKTLASGSLDSTVILWDVSAK